MDRLADLGLTGPMTEPTTELAQVAAAFLSRSSLPGGARC